MEYEDREKFKSDAWRIYFDKTATQATRASAALRVIEAHYWRAREALSHARAPFKRMVHGGNYCRSYELDIDIYTTHWLAANGKLFDDDTILYIKNHYFYDARRHKLLPDGHTSYVRPVKK